MKKGLVNYIYIITFTLALFLNNSFLSYGESILNDNDNTINILAINSYDSKNTWENEIFKGFTKTFNELKPKELKLNIQLEFLDIRESNNKDYLDTFNSLLNHKYKNKDIDLVLTIDDESLDFVKSELLNENSVLYHKKVLFTGVDADFQIEGEYSKYIMGVHQPNKDNSLINTILLLHPNTNTINVLLDKFTFSKSTKERILEIQRSLNPNVKINFIESNYIEDIEEQLKNINAKNQVNIITGTFMNKYNNAVITSEDIVQKIKKVSNNPLYTNSCLYIKSGVIGGYVDIGEKQGEQLAHTVLNTLNKRKNNEITTIPARYIFNYNQIYNYDIDVLKIPKDRIILNKPKYALILPKEIIALMHLAAAIVIILSILVIAKIYKERKIVNKNKALYEKSVEKEKLKTDFIIKMSHELRTPLNVILGTCRVLEVKINKAEYDNNYLLDKVDTISRNSNSLLRYANNLIDITRSEFGYYELHLENFNIVELIEDVVLETINYAQHKDIEVIFDTDEEEIITAIDGQAIERVILNLLSNAIRFTNYNGLILVTIKNTTDNVVIIVEDNGVGIPKDKLNKVFDSLYTKPTHPDNHQEGSGLGLCIVNEIIKLHNGEIKVFSELNKGTKFEIKLPKHTIEGDLNKSNINYIRHNAKLEMAGLN